MAIFIILVCFVMVSCVIESRKPEEESAKEYQELIDYSEQEPEQLNRVSPNDG